MKLFSPLLPILLFIVSFYSFPGFRAIMPTVFARLVEKTKPRLDLILCLVLAVSALALYIRTLAPGVLDGDSGEWQYMANILGIPHSTGYPLYVLLAKIVTFLPVKSPAWRVNLFSALCAALTIPVVYLLAKRVSRSRIAAVIVAAFFALMPTLWASAVIAEVYALNSLLLALTLYFAIRFYDNGQARDLWLMALCFGLALDNHRISFFILPALLVVIWLRRSVLDMRKISIAALAVVLPLLLYGYIPLRASQLLTEQTPENWALYQRAEPIVNGKITAYYNPTLPGFINLVTAFDNRNKVGFVDNTGNNITLARFTNSWSLLRQQIDPFGIILALLGIVILWRRDRALTIVLLVGMASISAISIVLRAESTLYYFSGAYLILLLFLATTIGWVLQKLDPRTQSPPLLKRNAWLQAALYYAAIIYFAFFPVTALYFNYPKMDQSDNTKYDAYAHAILNDDLAQNAVLVAPWEVATPIRYFQFVENIRPDVLTIHESPVNKQYQNILDAAHKLQRPFYYALFMPEDKNSDAPRTIQAVAFPKPDKPQPQHPLNFKLNDAVHIVGYDWEPLPNNSARLAVYYRVVKPTRIEYVSEMELSDAAQATRADINRHPVSEYYPTYFWKQGEYYRDVYDVHLNSDAPLGAYTADLTWYTYDASTAKRDENSAVTLHLDNLLIGQ